jgi:hypothetical protein
MRYEVVVAAGFRNSMLTEPFSVHSVPGKTEKTKHLRGLRPVRTRFRPSTTWSAHNRKRADLPRVDRCIARHEPGGFDRTA